MRSHSAPTQGTSCLPVLLQPKHGRDGTFLLINTNLRTGSVKVTFWLSGSGLQVDLEGMLRETVQKIKLVYMWFVVFVFSSLLTQ